MNLRHRWISSAALVAALLFAGLWLLREPRPDDKPASVGNGAAVIAPDVSPPSVAAAPTTTPRSSAFNAPAPTVAQLRFRLERSSLRGAGVDGELDVDPSGRPRLDAGLVRRFDHYLSLIGEFTTEEMRQLLNDDAQREHGDAVAAATLDAFDRYLGLRAELSAANLSDDLAIRFAQIQALRRKWFGADSDAMFRDEEAHGAYTLARRAVQQDASLDASERAVRLAELDAARPAAERNAERDATSVLIAEEQSRQFETRGTDAATRAAERRELWGEEAAQRLAALDRQRAQWDQRIADYVTRRGDILGDARLDPAARQRALSDLLQRSFDRDERRRIESLESIGALPPGG